MKNSALITAALLSTVAASNAFAQGETGSPAEKAGATFWVDHNVLTWSSRTVKPDGGSKTKEDSLQTTPDDITIGIFWKNFGVYVTPDTAGGVVGLSLFPQKEIEVGLNIGLNHTKTDLPGSAEDETKSESIGIFGNYYMQLDAISTLEFHADYLYSKTKVESTDAAGTSSDTDDKGNQFTIGVQYDYQIAEHFHILPGIYFNTGKSDHDAGGVSSDSDLTGLTLNIAHFRYVF